MGENNTVASPRGPENEGDPRRKRSWLRRILRFLCFGFLGILLLVLLGVVGLGFWIRTDQARTLVQEQVNTQLTPILAPMGLQCSLTSLSGTLPLTWVASLTLSDEKGLWLTVPEARVDLDFGLFPPRIAVDELLFVRPKLERLPVLPDTPKEPDPPSEPMTPEALEKLLREVAQTLSRLPKALPTVTVRKTGIKELSLPKEIAGFPLTVTALLDASFAMKDEGAGPTITFALPELSLSSEALNFSGKVAWESGKTEETLLAGDLSLGFDAALAPKAFLPEGAAFSADKVHVRLAAKGPLFSPKFSLETSCPRAEGSGHVLTESVFRLTSAPLDLAGFLAEKKAPIVVDVSLASTLDGEPISFAVQSFANLLRRDSFTHLAAGIRNLSLKALGLSVNGELATRVGYGMPPLSGRVHAEIPDMASLSSFVPDASLTGRLAADIALAHTKESGQAVSCDLSVPNLVFAPKGGDPVRIDALTLAAKLSDALGKGAFLANLRGGRIAAGPLALTLTCDASGAFSGPIRVALSTDGGIRTALRASLDEKSLALDSFSFETNPALFAKEFAHVKTPLALRLTKPVRANFDAHGFSLSELDVRMQPQGRLWARGGVRNQVCDLNLGLDDFDLKAWRALVKDLPEGLVRFSANFKGAVKSPTGSFRLSVNNLAVPKVTIAPFDLALVGALEPRGNLRVHLEVPEKTVRTLGGERLTVACALPLIFAENGVPSVQEKGPLTGTVVWRGKVAPLWKFSPLADCKVSGNLNCDITLGGTVSAPAIKGLVALEKGRFEDPILGILLRDIAAKIGIDGATTAKGLDGLIRIDAGLTDGMGGKLTVAGETPLDASNLAIKTTIDHLRPLRRQDVRVSLSGGIDVTGSAEAPVVAGTIVVDNGAIQLENIEAGPSGVTTLPIAGEKELALREKAKAEKTGSKKTGTGKERKKEAKGPGSLNIQIKSPGRFLVDGFGLSTEWKTNIAITGTPTNPIIDGEVTAVKGSMDFLNKIFKLDKGIVILNADTIANPLIDIKLANTSSDITSYILVTGTVKKMKLSLTSEPPMPQDDVMAHILFGKNANELGRSEALQLAAALARMASGLGSGLQGSRKALGLDVMRLKSGGKDGSSSGDKWVEGMALESGKYLTDSIYVGVEQGVKQDSTAGIIQLEITPTLKLEMRTQQSSTKGSLDWKYNY